MTDCKLDTLPGLCDLSDLEILGVDGNPLGCLTLNEEAYPKIQILYASGCNLDTIPPLKEMQNLANIDLSCNDLEVCSGREQLDSISQMTQDLNLSFCGLKELPNLHRCNQLQSLNLSGNPLGIIPFGDFELPHLQILRVKECKLQSLPDLTKLPNLTELDVSGNPLTMLHEASEVCSYREQLDCISQMTYLQNLNLSFCGLKELPNLHRLIQLQTLDLSGNPLGIIPSWEFELPDLQILRVKECELQSLPGLTKLPNLSELDVSGTFH